MKLTKIILALFLALSISVGIFSYKALASEILFNDRYFHFQWGLDNANDIDIDFPEVRAMYSGGKQETIVAVIDTGVDYNHEDLQDAFWVNKGEIPENGIDDDGNGYIDDVHGWNFYDNNNVLYDGKEDMHGTHVTGIIAATINSRGIAGVAGSSSVKIMVLKVMKDEAGYTFNIVNAINYAEKMGAKICNLSFGTESTDKDLEETIKNSKMLFVIAAGNGDAITEIGNNIDLNPMYPASYSYDNIITVANLQEDGKLHPSSNYSYTAVDIAAPGTKILSTIDSETFNVFPNISSPYGSVNGTSMAAPFVTGTAALLYSDFPGITLSQVREAILNGAKSLPSLYGKVGTGGMLSALGAYNYAYNHYQSFLDFNKKIEEAKIKEEKIEEAKRLAEIKKEETRKLEETKKLEMEREKAELKKKELKEQKRQEEIKKLKTSIKFYRTKTGKMRLKIGNKGIVAVRAVKGKKGITYFKKGTKGYEIKLNKRNEVVLALKKGIATFYVIDKQGHEVIKRVVVK